MLLPCYIWCWTPLRRAQRSQCLESESPSSTFEIWSEWSEAFSCRAAGESCGKVLSRNAARFLFLLCYEQREYKFSICLSKFCKILLTYPTYPFMLQMLQRKLHRTPKKRNNARIPGNRRQFLHLESLESLISYSLDHAPRLVCYARCKSSHLQVKSALSCSRLPPSGWIFVALLAGQWNPG